MYENKDYGANMVITKKILDNLLALENSTFIRTLECLIDT